MIYVNLCVAGVHNLYFETTCWLVTVNIWSRDISFGTDTRLGAGKSKNWASNPGWGTSFSSFHSPQTGSGKPPASSPLTAHDIPQDMTEPVHKTENSPAWSHYAKNAWSCTELCLHFLTIRFCHLTWLSATLLFHLIDFKPRLGKRH